MITKRFAVTVVATTAKAHRQRRVGLRCYGPCTTVSCAGVFPEYFELAFIYDRVVSHSKFVQKYYVSH